MTAQLELVHPAPVLELGGAPRADHDVIAQLIDEGARVLDVGCGDGALLSLLVRTRGAAGRGLERSGELARVCVTRGLAVVQGDANRDLREFPSASFDVVILSHTLLHLEAPLAALKEAGRIGARVIVSTKNAAHWRRRTRLMLKGRGDASWAGAEPARAASVRDMAELARAARLSLESAVPISGGRAGAPFAKTLWRANWFADEAVFLLAP